MKEFGPGGHMSLALPLHLPMFSCVNLDYCDAMWIVLKRRGGVRKLVICRFKFIERLREFSSILNGADTAYTCKHSVCLHTQQECIPVGCVLPAC